MTACPVPGCGKQAPKNNIFCPDCYFRIPPGYTRAINRLHFECARTEDDDKRDHLRKQLTGYISIAIKAMSGGAHAA